MSALKGPMDNFFKPKKSSTNSSNSNHPPISSNHLEVSHFVYQISNNLDILSRIKANKKKIPYKYEANYDLIKNGYPKGKREAIALANHVEILGIIFNMLATASNTPLPLLQCELINKRSHRAVNLFLFTFGDCARFRVNDCLLFYQTVYEDGMSKNDLRRAAAAKYSIKDKEFDKVKYDFRTICICITTAKKK
eukprot:652819_1